MLKVGFTGSQNGMSLRQRTSLIKYLEKLLEKEAAARSASLPLVVLHHGGCIGSDFIAHCLGVFLACKIIVHPSTLVEKQFIQRFQPGWLGVSEVRDVKAPLVRNHDIVDETSLLIATPRSEVEILRSGTWATVRYCRDKVKKPYEVLYP